jgi:hypothetical protein
VVPSVSVDLTLAWPSWALAISLTMKRPSPTLRPTLVVVGPRFIGWNSSAWAGSGIGTPSLWTAIENDSCAMVEVTVTAVPGAP